MSNSRSMRAEFSCPKGPHQYHINTRTDNSQNLCPVCTKHSRGGISEEELERTRQVSLREKRIVELGLENRRQEIFAWEKRLEDQKEIARQAELARQAERTRQEMVSRHWARLRQEELEKQNARIRRQPSAPKESPSQGVAKRYVRHQLDLEERGERREEGYRSQTGHSKHTELARQTELAEQKKDRRPTQDAKQRVTMSERESSENENEDENESESDRIQKQLEREHIAEETRQKKLDVKRKDRGSDN
ncbi:hypothetical protein BCON_0023g00580 [Botryotinia convoluta]|uniref:Uncharacterized protein n=1 Tax=Botryotinia convoluta TaxID=54673 RepID=A0A4Z1IKR8_9HELO|nr:hypothetical protein BCON_0023g00580 [Botryotinia convoluta]